jgi:hypothetical protein
MATGNIRRTGGKRNYARPTAPTTATLTASASTAAVDFSITPSTLGPTATSYIVGGTSNDGGATTSFVTNSTSGAATGFTVAKTYDVYVSGRNYNGEGQRTQTTSVVIPGQYELAETFNTNGTYTIPSGKTKLAGIIVSAGGSGGSTGPGTVNTSAVGGGGGGGSGAIAAFWEFSVTAGQTATITVGSAGVASKIAYGGVDIATANAGGTPSTNTTLTGGTGGSGGNATSNIATNISLTNGYAGRSGGNGGDGGGVGNSPSGGQALPTTEVVNFNTTSFTFSPNSNVTVLLGGGGGGGGGGHSNGNTGFAGANGGAGGSPSAANGNNRGSSGGEGGSANNNNLAGNLGSTSGSPTFIGAGAGGAGGSGANTPQGRPNNSVTAGTGGPARVYVYTR